MAWLDLRYGLIVGMHALLGCSTNDATPSRDASVDYRVPSDGGFGGSACGQCVAAQCAAERAACDSEPTCAVTLACSDACPVTAAGSLDAACAASCAAPVGSAAVNALAQLQSCRARVGGGACPACGGATGDGGSADPILNQVCAASTDPDDCHRCEDERCCMTKQKCRDNADCDAYRLCYLSCLDGGTSPSCTQTCADAHDAGFADFAPRIACVSARCGDPCGPADPCTACIVRECRDAYVGCQESPGCVLLGECFGGCRQVQSCIDGCFTTFASSKAAYIAQFLCAADRCSSECN
jgi:hypothetical protein